MPEPGGGSPQRREVELGDLFVRPGSVEVPAGTELIVDVTNNGAMAHDLELDGRNGSRLLQPGERGEVSLGVIDESTEHSWR